MIARLMGTDLTVTIIGESGTGKELVARALHNYGKRRNAPFVAINMAAIPRELIESELFGHEKGAFTGATSRSMGRFEQAQGGTLFLDEIGDMPLEAQTRLLRVLQEGEFTAVGGRMPIRADVRVIAATHHDLRNLIRHGLFREDLFYRLNVAPIRLPPLRERTADIPALVRHFVALAMREGLPPKQLDDEAMERLRNYRWPGNVRELENLIRRLAALYPQEVIGAAVIDAELGETSGTVQGIDAPNGEGLAGAVERHIRGYFAAHKGGLPAAGLYDRVLREVERPLIVLTLRGDPRQPDQSRSFIGSEPQHPAQENPRVGHSGRPRAKVASGITGVICAAGAWRAGPTPAACAVGGGYDALRWGCGMTLMRRVRLWSGRIGLRHQLAIGLAAAALASGAATYLALTGGAAIRRPAGRRADAAQSRSRFAAGARRADRQASIAGLGRKTARPRRLAAADPACHAVQPDRGDADDHRRDLCLSFFQLRRAVVVQRPGAHRNLEFAGRRRSLSARASAGDCGPTRWRWPTISTATRSNSNWTRSGSSKLVSGQAALRGLTEAMVFDRAGHVLARSSLSFSLGFRADPGGR